MQALTRPRPRTRTRTRTRTGTRTRTCTRTYTRTRTRTRTRTPIPNPDSYPNLTPYPTRTLILLRAQYAGGAQHAPPPTTDSRAQACFT